MAHQTPDDSELPKCSECNNLLSYFPICHTLDFKTICGRCPINSTPGIDHNVSYETSVITKLFPCRYQSLGCEEKRCPPEVPQHESKCPYRTIKCPTSDFSKCPWLGIPEHLLDHSQQEHSDYFFEDNSFTMDVRKSYGVYSFVKHNVDTIFLVLARFDQTKNSFGVSAMRCGHANDSMEFLCLVTLVNGTRKLKLRVPTFVGGYFSPVLATEIDLKSLGCDPSNYFATIKIEIIEKISLSKEKISTEKVLLDLDCQICCVCMTPPIFLCLNGHSICKNCHTKVNSCPFCKSLVTDSRNYCLEKIASLPIHKCPFEPCTFIGNFVDVWKHELFCLYRNNTLECCPFVDCSGCVVIGSKRYLLNHMTLDHRDRFFKSNFIEIRSVDLTLGAPQVFILNHYEKLFCLKLLNDGEFLNVAVQLNGPVEDRRQFSYKMSVLNNDRELLLKRTGLPLGDNNAIAVSLQVFRKMNVPCQNFLFHFSIVK